jgi:DNA-binding HxlR family transcriptional regulator
MLSNKSKTESDVSCPIEKTLGIIGNKWTMLIIRDLMKSKKRFGELEKSLHGISSRTLSLRLVQLEKDKIIKKKIYPVIPPHTEYSLSSKGWALASILGEMIEWGESYA